ncbi:MAG TPA: hypothetical protein VN893_22955 [Bryobacteraceae bacterium]|nr:hypothetical protein [Bryobacteraceae bacterium]
MRRTAVAIVALGLAGLAQTPPSVRTSEEHFRWSRRKAQELGYDQTIRRSSELSPNKKASLIDAIAAEIRPFKADLEIHSERELRALSANTRVKLVDLNEDGVAEVLAQANDFKAGCGGTGNCPFWVFQETPAGFRKLLDTRGKDGIGGIEVFTVAAGRSNGFNDLVLGAHDSASERTLFVYRFRDGQYRVGECYDADWACLECPSGALEEPKITRLNKCQ